MYLVSDKHIDVLRSSRAFNNKTKTKYLPTFEILNIKDHMKFQEMLGSPNPKADIDNLFKTLNVGKRPNFK